MGYIKINDEIINTDCINFIKYDKTNFRIMIYINDIFDLSYTINSKYDDEDKKNIWYNYMVSQLENEIDVDDWDKRFENHYASNFEQDII